MTQSARFSLPLLALTLAMFGVSAHTVHAQYYGAQYVPTPYAGVASYVSNNDYRLYVPPVSTVYDPGYYTSTPYYYMKPQPYAFSNMAPYNYVVGTTNPAYNNYPYYPTPTYYQGYYGGYQPYYTGSTYGPYAQQYRYW